MLPDSRPVLLRTKTDYSTHLVQVVGVEGVVDERDESGGAVVRVEDEDVIVGTALDGLAAAHEHFLALQDLQEVDRVDVLAGVVLGNVVVHVWAVRVVPDDAGGRVPVVAGNIILPVVKYT